MATFSHDAVAIVGGNRAAGAEDLAHIDIRLYEQTISPSSRLVDKVDKGGLRKGRPCVYKHERGDDRSEKCGMRARAVRASGLAAQNDTRVPSEHDDLLVNFLEEAESESIVRRQ